MPTMGALHEGHASLVRTGVALSRSRNIHSGVMVTIFVNPTQFNDAADFARYPQTLEADLAACEAAGAASVFAPTRDDVYPEGEDVVVPPLPDVARLPELEDRFRPGHFAGVCQVVKRLFELTEPRIAIFGEKDWQQYQVIRAMTSRERMEIEIVGAPTVREPDGLAMSSRNRFLSPEDRAHAKSLSTAIQLANRCRTVEDAENAMVGELRSLGLEIDYAAVRDAETLLKPRADRPSRCLIAARTKTVRLIDNDAWKPAA